MSIPCSLHSSSFQEPPRFCSVTSSHGCKAHRYRKKTVLSQVMRKPDLPDLQISVFVSKRRVCSMSEGVCKGVNY